MTITLKGVFWFFTVIFYLCLAAFFGGVMAYCNHVPKEELQWFHSWAHGCAVGGLVIQAMLLFIFGVHQIDPFKEG